MTGPTQKGLSIASRMRLRYTHRITRTAEMLTEAQLKSSLLTQLQPQNKVASTALLPLCGVCAPAAEQLRTAAAPNRRGTSSAQGFIQQAHTERKFWMDFHFLLQTQKRFFTILNTNKLQRPLKVLPKKIKKNSLCIW